MWEDFGGHTDRQIHRSPIIVRIIAHGSRVSQSHIYNYSPQYYHVPDALQEVAPYQHNTPVYLDTYIHKQLTEIHSLDNTLQVMEWEVTTLHLKCL